MSLGGYPSREIPVSPDVEEMDESSPYVTLEGDVAKRFWAIDVGGVVPLNATAKIVGKHIDGNHVTVHLRLKGLSPGAAKTMTQITEMVLDMSEPSAG